MDFWRGQWRDLLSVKAQLQADETLKVVVIQLVVIVVLVVILVMVVVLVNVVTGAFKVTECKQRTRKLFRFSVSDSVGIDVQLNCSLAPWQVPLFRLACLNPWIYKQTICQGVDWRHFLGRPHNWWLEPSTPGHRNISSVLWQWDLSDTTVLASYMTRWWWTKGPSIS